MRRFRSRAAGVSLGSSGWNSPKPAATRRFAGTPFAMRYFNDGRGARRGQFPVVAEAPGPDSGTLSVCPSDPQDPVDLRRDFLLQFDDRAGKLAHLVLSGAVLITSDRRKQNLGLEDEAVADDADVLAIRKDLAQASEEVRAIAVS